MTESIREARQRIWRRPIWFTRHWLGITLALWVGYGVGAYMLWVAGVDFGMAAAAALIVGVGHVASAIMTAVVLAWFESLRVQALQLERQLEQELQQQERFAAEVVYPTVSTLTGALAAAFSLVDRDQSPN